MFSHMLRYFIIIYMIIIDKQETLSDQKHQKCFVFVNEVSARARTSC